LFCSVLFYRRLFWNGPVLHSGPTDTIPFCIPVRYHLVFYVYIAIRFYHRHSQICSPAVLISGILCSVHSFSCTRYQAYLPFHGPGSTCISTPVYTTTFTSLLQVPFLFTWASCTVSCTTTFLVVIPTTHLEISAVHWVGSFYHRWCHLEFHVTIWVLHVLPPPHACILPALEFLDLHLCTTVPFW